MLKMQRTALLSSSGLPFASSRRKATYNVRSSVRSEVSPQAGQVVKTGARFNKLRDVEQFIFIRHGEKTSNNEEPGLSTQGYIRALHIPKVFGKDKTAPNTYKTPDVIYAMKQKEVTSSRRPFDTVVPLAIKLGMDPVMGERTGKHGEKVFDARFERPKDEKKPPLDLIENILKHADVSYVGKTILFSWQHENISAIVAELGLLDVRKSEKDIPLAWGFNPFSGKDEKTNYNAIWVFTPEKEGTDEYFKIYKMFDIEPNHVDEKGRSPPDEDPKVEEAVYTHSPAKGPYSERMF